MSNTLNHISNTTTGQNYYASGTNQTDYTVGDLLTGTVLQGGEHPVVEMNGTPVQVRSNALKDAQTGDRIYLHITGSNSSEITLKLIDQQEQSIYTRSGTMQTEIRRNTARFVDTWNETCPDADTQAGQLKEDAEEVSRSLSEEERAKLRQMGIEVSASNITFIKSLLSQMRGKEQDEQLQQAIDSVRKQIIIEQLDEHPEAFRMVVGDTSFDLPDALKQLNDQLPLTKEQAVYFIQSQAPFSPDELYKSAFSSKSMPTRKPISDEAFTQLLPQIDRTLQAAGLDTTQEQHDAARFLLEYQLPVTTDSLLTYQAVQDLNTNGFTMDSLRTHMEDFIAETEISTGASDTSITVSDIKHLFESSEQYFPAPSKVADAIMDDLNRITDTDMAAFAASGLPYTLEALSAFSRQRAATSGSNVSFDNPSDVTSAAAISDLTALRQLEELRLKMTWSAGYALASEDIHIRTRDLTQVVDALREQETAAYRQQMTTDGILPTNTEIALIQETNHKLAELPALPAAAIGRTWASGSFTIQRLHTDGIQALSEYRASSRDALSSYETMMTTPRSDMGDSIHKAFRNVDPILRELQLPVTEANARAVRILGYNRMELTPENISQVKAADQEVQTLIQNLQPSVVLHLVEDGINPLNMPIQELNALAEEYIADADVASDEKYSTFLQKLDRRKQISREERTGYIGIYRLIDKITRSQGKDIGTLVRNGQDLTLQNLLTAHRSNRSTGMDTTVDETFGGIDVQTAGTNDSVANDIQSQIERGTQTAYQSQLVRNLRDALSPDVIDSMVQESASGVTLEEFLDRIEKQLTTEAPVDSSAPAAESMADHTPDLSAFDGTDYQLMQDLQLLPSINNMEALLQLTKGNGIFFQNLSNTIQSLDSSADTAHKKLSQLDEALSSPEAMEAAYSDLEQTAATATETAEQAGTITARDIQALKQIRSGLRILEKMSRQEQYQIPMEMDGTWGVLHLSVIQNSGKNRSLQASLPTRQYGLLQANLEWNGADWDTTLTAERSEGVTFLEQNRDAFATALDAITRTTASAGNTTSAGTTSPEAPDTAVADRHSDSDTAPSTDEMYQIAKKLVVFFRHILK